MNRRHFALLALVSLLTLPAALPQINDFYNLVLRSDNPAPDRPDEWITLGHDDAGRGALTANGKQVVSKHTTTAAAAAEADALMLSSNFQSVCRRSWYATGNNQGVKSVCNDCLPHDGIQRLSSAMCCIDAMNAAFPGKPQANDCRVVPLKSVPGASVFWNGGKWVSMTGFPITIPIARPNKPVIPADPTVPLPGPPPPPMGTTPKNIRPTPPETKPATVPPIFGPVESVDPGPTDREPPVNTRLPPRNTVTPAPPTQTPPGPSTATAPRPAATVGAGRWALVSTDSNLFTFPHPNCSISAGSFAMSSTDAENHTSDEASITFQAPPVISSDADAQLTVRATGSIGSGQYIQGWFRTDPLKVMQTIVTPAVGGKAMVEIRKGSSSSQVDQTVRMDAKGPETFDLYFVVQANCLGGYPNIASYTYRRNGIPATAVPGKASVDTLAPPTQPVRLPGTTWRAHRGYAVIQFDSTTTWQTLRGTINFARETNGEIPFTAKQDGNSLTIAPARGSQEEFLFLTPTRMSGYLGYVDSKGLYYDAGDFRLEK